MVGKGIINSFRCLAFSGIMKKRKRKQQQCTCWHYGVEVEIIPPCHVGYKTMLRRTPVPKVDTKARTHRKAERSEVEPWFGRKPTLVIIKPMSAQLLCDWFIISFLNKTRGREHPHLPCFSVVQAANMRMRPDPSRPHNILTYGQLLPGPPPLLPHFGPHTPEKPYSFNKIRWVILTFGPVNLLFNVWQRCKSSLE